MTGAELIEAERIRQVAVEGYTSEHDATFRDGQLAWAAVCYAAPGPVFRLYDGILYDDPWPWNGGFDKRDDHDRLRQLVIAGALIAAEIDRMQAELSNNTLADLESVKSQREDR
jgi:hypothetical protein